MNHDLNPIHRRRWRATGAVQGVGFRPFVYGLAVELGLDGFVRNDPAGVDIEASGPAAMLEHFEMRLRDAPAPARVDRLERVELDASVLPSVPQPSAASRTPGFHILASVMGAPPSAAVLPDLATCPDCLRELFEPADRRYRYPFLTCTRCGPRYSIVTAVPYDRLNTTLAGFPLCPACHAEYQAPADRRFHAQATACPACGPQLAWRDGAGRPKAEGNRALLAAEVAIRGGVIVALQGLGGFHLVCDARNEAAVRRLRERKRREAKPLAVMVPTLDAARALADVSDAEAACLVSPEAPIVLLLRRRDAAAAPLAEGIAPGRPDLGLMLPYTPLHHLLMADLGFPVVATSGNRSDEPLCVDPDEAVRRLEGIADGFLVHNRPIARPVDDSVVRVVCGEIQVLRRARGFAPASVRLAPPAPEPILAVGPHLKNTVALALGDRVMLSPHLGDLEEALACENFDRAIEALEFFHEAHAAIVAHDLHPDYYATQFALRRGGRRVAVAHHHAHVAAVLAEHGLDGEVLGLAWDGAGLGPDGTIWGGEFLRADRRRFIRVGRFHPFPLPGGDTAARDPRRAALGALFALGGTEALAHDLGGLRARFPPQTWSVWTALLPRPGSAPVTSSAGRLFDAVAALTGLCDAARYEGEAAMAVEAAAARWLREDSTLTPALSPPGKGGGMPWPVVWVDDAEAGAAWDWRPMLSALLAAHAGGTSAECLAARFHRTLIEVIVAAARRFGLPRVVLSGGCFQNRILLEGGIAALRAADFDVFWPRLIPPNDGGIALGQAAVAAARLGG